MIYKFCEDKLDYIRVSLKKPLLIASTTTLIVIGSVSVVSYYIGRFQQINSLSQFEKEVLILTHDEMVDPFSEDKFAEMLNQLNVKFPHIATAQSMLETSSWSSDIFKENNNLFGMKEAKHVLLLLMVLYQVMPIIIIGENQFMTMLSTNLVIFPKSKTKKSILII